MVDGAESETGALEGLSPLALALVERAQRNAALAPPPDQQQPSESQASPSDDGDWRISAALRRAGVPTVYHSAEWRLVRSLAVQEWALGLRARTLRRSDPEPPNWALLGHGLLIMGPTGTGKSSAAALCIREALRLDRSALWTYVPDLLDKMTLGPKERTHEIRRQSAVDLLVWDDFGVRDMADWEVGYLDQIVDARYRNRKPMVITTNLLGEDITADQRLARLTDRWRERTASGGVVLGGESMRGTGDQEGAR